MGCPAGWPGYVIHGAVGIASVVVLIPIGLATIPWSWSAWLGSHWLVRGAILVTVWRALLGIRALATMMVPGAPALVAGVLTLFLDGVRLWIPLRDVVDVSIEFRAAPDYQAFVVELQDGRTLDVCPVGWFGADQLFVGLDRAVRRRQRRSQRREKRWARRRERNRDR